MIIITAFNEACRPCGDLCLSSLMQHNQRFRGDQYAYAVIPKKFKRPPSWFKVGYILKHLEEGHDVVMWTDADTIVRGKVELSSRMGTADLNISVDENGINCGVMAWRNSPKVIEFLRGIDNDSEEFTDHIWWEQAAIMARLDEITVNFQTKSDFNAYPHDATPDSWILHWPGIPIEEKLPLMEQALKEAYQ